MTNGVDTRGIALEILLEITQKQEYSHIAIRNALDKVQYLPKQERAFINRIVEGTIEYMLRIDYILNQYSNVKVTKMKPVIRNILRSSVYQLLFMDSVPDSAACNEAVKLAQKKGFYSLKGFVNGVLRTISREKESIRYPERETNLSEYLSIYYSMPLWMIERWLGEYGVEVTEKMLKDSLADRPTTIRCQLYRMDPELTVDSLRRQGAHLEPAPYLPYAWYLSEYSHLAGLKSFVMGRFVVQDVSSMLVAEAAAPKKGDYVIDLCSAPGGKSLHVADKMEGYGHVDARDLTEYKVDLIRENIHRTGAINIEANQKDATVLDKDSIEKADIVLADVPCSGLGVIGKKTDIKYRIDPEKIKELVVLQRQILHNAAAYVKPGGTLIYSTCTITREENIENVRWFLENYPYELESLDPYLCEELHSETTKEGYLQLLPGVHKTDGFFLARLVKKNVEVTP
ncbi:MAG: 16S rRNA (cytosine(967)-C(5))-methyltransferase RsmB [Clostridia bacterium]|nr:16S rRNA (cytosine(967)-C(5))-methyltransferase RsmB [Clostridia bacterium]NCC42245.1 16S rRNA (cytosine(967)-C(5))-methyltransferase RsmB [Clostridia bacterium]